MYPLLLYCYDAYCDWCYGFSSVITRLEEEYRGRINVEVLSGGMILPKQPKPISILAGYLKSLSTEVAIVTGVKYGSEYLWHIENPVKAIGILLPKNRQLLYVYLKHIIPYFQCNLPVTYSMPCILKDVIYVMMKPIVIYCINMTFLLLIFTIHSMAKPLSSLLLKSFLFVAG